MLVSCGSVLTICMIIELGVSENIKALFRALIFDLGILCIINLILVLLFPGGMYTTSYTEHWLLGYDNVHIVYILPLICFYTLYADARKTSFLRKLLFWGIISASVYITWSATSVVGCTLFFVIIIMNEMNCRPRFMNSYTYLVVTLVVFFSIVIFQFFDIFRVIIVNLLHKDMTFTGRIAIWDLTMYVISRKPVFGYGVMDAMDSMSIINASHAHNYYLQVGYECGVVGLVCFSVILLMTCKKLYDARSSREGFLLSGFLFCFLVMFLDEAYVNIIPFYGTIVCMYHVKELSQGLSQLPPVRTGIRRINYRLY